MMRFILTRACFIDDETFPPLDLFLFAPWHTGWLYESIKYTYCKNHHHAI